MITEQPLLDFIRERARKEAKAPSSSREEFDPFTDPIVPAQRTPSAQPTAGESTSATSWRPVDLEPILSGDQVTPGPVILSRTDNKRLFYPGKMHSVIGEPESLKSWLVLLAAAEEITAGSNVVWFDVEDSPESVTARLRALGCSSDNIVNHFHYVRPTEPLQGGADAGTPDRQAFRGLLALRPTLAVIDGVTEAMALHGLSPDANKDAADFLRLWARPFTLADAALVMLDHVTKSKENRGRFAIGVQHKLAGIDGAAYSVRLIKPFGHGLHGIAQITVSKDRPGRVREYAVGAKDVGELHLRSEPDGSVFGEIRPPSASAGEPFRPTVLMERASRGIEISGGGLSMREIYIGVTGKDSAITTAVRVLIDEGYVVVDKRGQQKQLHRSLRPFREGAES